jgi:hypothetical protein
MFSFFIKLLAVRPAFQMPKFQPLFKILNNNRLPVRRAFRDTNKRQTQPKQSFIATGIVRRLLPFMALLIQLSNTEAFG